MSIAEEAAKDHVEYVLGVLRAHGQDDRTIRLVEHHYVTAFIHGWKHGIENYVGRPPCRPE